MPPMAVSGRAVRTAIAFLHDNAELYATFGIDLPFSTALSWAIVGACRLVGAGYCLLLPFCTWKVASMALI